MATVRSIVSEAKHADGLTKFTGPILDIGASSVNVPEYIRRVRTWLELHAIDGTASGLSVTPFVEPIASFPKANGPNSWIPIDPDTGAPAVLDEKTLEKLKGAKFVAHASIQVNLDNQARVIFQVLLNSSISKQSQAAVKNSTDWDALSVDLKGWAALLNLIVKIHTIQRGALVGEAAIVAKITFDSKIRNFKQTGGTDSGAHLERFDDLVAEGRAIGANMDQRELAYLVVNSMKSGAARNKRSLLMDLGQNTPQSYAVAKAFVLEAEAMARSVAEFNSGYHHKGHAAVTDHADSVEKETKDTSEIDAEEGANLITATSKATRRIYTVQQKKNWKTLNQDSKKKVMELEQLADKIRAGESIDVDLRTITSALTSSVAPLSQPKKCWKCKGDHIMSECPQKDSIKGAPHAPIRKRNNQKKSDVVALTQESAQEEDSEDDYYYHLDNLVTYRGCWKSKRGPIVHPDGGLFLDESENEDDPTVTQEEACLITEDIELEGTESSETLMQQLRSLRGLDTAVREPTSEEIVFQADLIGMPRLCRAELERNRWQTVSVNGVTVVKGGCFDTTNTNVVWSRWGPKNVPDIAETKPSIDRPKLVSAKERYASDEKTENSLEDQETMIKSWIARGHKERERDSGDEESGDFDYEQLAYLTQENEDLTMQLSERRKDLDTVRSQLDRCSTEKLRAQLEYKRALEVVREVAAKELTETKNESVKEIYRIQSELERAKAELKEKEKVVSEVQAEAISGSLRRALERNAYLVDCLNKVDEERSQEKEQSAFHRSAFEKERAETKALAEKLTEYRTREEERVNSYRKALAEERQVSSSLRQTLKDLERKELPLHESSKDTDREIDRLTQELKAVEEKLIRSMEKGNKTEEKLRESEQTSKEAIEELDRHRAFLFPQKLRDPISSETHSQGSGGRYEELAYEWNDREEEASVAESEGTRKRPPTNVSSVGMQGNKQKKAKRVQKENESSASTPNKQAPVFDPSTMQQITPIFARSGDKQKSSVEEEEAEVNENKRETGLKDTFDELSIQTANSDRKRKKERALRNELAKLAPGNGIDLTGYTSKRNERRDADEAAALEREKSKARKSILWNCSQSIEVRANLRVTEFSVTEVNDREKIYKGMLAKSKDEGPNIYMDFLNEECKYSTHQKLTTEWLEDQVRLWLRDPKSRQRTIKLPMPPRDPVFYQRIMDDRERRASERKARERQDKEKTQEQEKTEEREEKINPTRESKEEDSMPGLVSDSGSDDDDRPSRSRREETLAMSEEEEQELVNTKIAEESLATIEHLQQSSQEEGEELTIHDLDVVTLDNAASTHIFRNDKLLHSLRQLKGGGVTIGGLKAGGEGVTCEKKGMFLSATGVLFGRESIANLLSQGTLVDQGHHVEYDTPQDVFTVKFRGTSVNLVFRRQKRAESETKTKHYVCKINPIAHTEETVLIETIKERQGKYTKTELAEAAKAREQSAALNYPSVAAHLDMIEQGSIDANGVTKEALQRSVEIWGRPKERSKGNSVHAKPTAASKRINDLPRQAPRQQSAHADLLFVRGVIFLIVVLDPMKYVWVHRLISKTTEEIRKGVNKFFADMTSYRVSVTCLRSDGEGGLWALESEIKMRGSKMDKAAAGKHVELAERKIRQVKEGVRRIVSSLPYLLCKVLLIACVYHAVQCINLQRTKSQVRDGLPSPYNQLTGQRINAKLHIVAPFGTYVEAAVRETDNSTEPRTDSAIFCSSALQATEANHVYLIRTNEMALRGSCEKKAMGQGLVDILDRRARRDWGEQTKDIYFEEEGHYTEEQALEEDTPTGVPEEEHTSDITPPDERRVTRSMTIGAGGLEGYELDQALGRPSSGEDPSRTNDIAEETGDERHIRTPERPNTERGTFRESGFWDRHGPAETADYFQEGYLAAAHLDMGSSPSRQAAEWRETEQVDSTSTGFDVPMQQQYDALLARELNLRKDWYYKEYALVMSQKQAIKKLGEKIALPAINKELKQLIDKKVWRPVKWNSLTEKEKREAINSHMFLKEKYDALGLFDKLKGRLVARGDEQDKDMYDNLSSPTARLTSLFSVTAIAASEGRKVEVGDIPGAYLNADMKDKVIMRINRVMSTEICKIDSSYQDFLDDKGCLSVVLLKAMYGCIQSAKLWNDDLAKVLTSTGFTANPEDPCVFNKGSVADKDQITVIVYVDDLLATCLLQSSLDDLWKVLRAHYAKPGQPDIEVKRGPIVNYLGMTFDWSSPGKVRITQLGFQSELITESGIDTEKRAATSPAAENLFDTRSDEEAGEIEKDEKDRFHRLVAKCLYLAKRTRPEILTTVAFLCTRVTRSNMDDVKKLNRLLSYIAGTKERGIILCPGLRGIQVRTFVDAAYGVHADFKSSSGSTTVLGDAGPISASSSKQSIVTKSSMEAELVASSDMMNEPFHVRRMLIAQGYSPGPIVLYQDNLSCMALIAKGKAGSGKTRHISIRYYWIKQHVDSGDVVVEKLATEEMPANILTKPLQGSQFRYERKLLTNWED